MGIQVAALGFVYVFSKSTSFRSLSLPAENRAMIRSAAFNLMEKGTPAGLLGFKYLEGSGFLGDDPSIR